MPNIESAIVFTEAEIDLINQKLADNSFTHLNWGDPDLEGLRKSIRGFYKIKQIGKCAYCRGNVSLHSASNCHVEHIAPKSLHFSFIFTPKNLCVICADCNQIKRDQETVGVIEDTVQNPTNRKQYPRSSSAFKIVHPHFDNYFDHIVIINGFYMDRTNKGHLVVA